MTRSAVWTGAGVALAGALALSAYSTFVGDTKEQQTSSYWIVAGVITLITFAVFAGVDRRTQTTNAANSRAKAGLFVSIVGLLSAAVFWSGLPVILGSAGAVLGYEARNHAERGRPGGRMALSALILGIVAIAAGVAASVSEKVL